MSVPMMSSVRDAIKNMALEFKWEERKKNPNMEKGNSLTSEIERINKQAEQHRKAMVILGIEGKLKSGQRLSAKEMDYLKENAPELYDKAVKIEKEREEYRRELERCKTKDDVRELNTRKIMQLDAEVKAVKQSNMPASAKRDALEFIGMRLAAIMNEHTDFTQTPEYKSLPTRQELEDDEKRRKAEKYKPQKNDDLWSVLRKKDKPEIKKAEENGDESVTPSDPDNENSENPAETGDPQFPGFEELMGKISSMLAEIGGSANRNRPTAEPGIYNSGGKKKTGAQGTVSVDV